MDLKESIIEATTELISENKDNLNEITIRDISKKAEVGLGLVNYHFGSKEKLIEICVERMVNKVIDKFKRMQSEVKDMDPFVRRTMN